MKKHYSHITSIVSDCRYWRHRL